MSVPAPLLGWQRELDEQLPGLIPKLVQWLGPLKAALDAFSSSPQPGAEEPEGFGGLSRRGPYERLTLSEWAIRHVAPQEFLRRAAMQEQLFLEIERREPSHKGRIEVVLDAGPEMLGQPRLVQLALLLLLAKRAEERGCEMRWTTLQMLDSEHPRPLASEDSGPAPSIPWVSGLKREGVLKWINSRSQWIVDDELWRRTWPVVDPAGRGSSKAEGVDPDNRPSELWCLGGGGLAERLQASHPQGRGARAEVFTARFSQKIDLDEDSLDVEFSKGAMRRSLRLPMIEGRKGVVLLRRPFEALQSVPAPLDYSPPPVFAAFDRSGQRVLRQNQGRIEGYLVSPKLPNQPTGLLDRALEGDRLIAAGFIKRRLVGLFHTVGGELASYGILNPRDPSRRYRQTLPAGQAEFQYVAADEAPWPLFGAWEGLFVVWTPEGQLITIDVDLQEPAQVALDSICAVGPKIDDAVMLCRREPAPANQKAPLTVFSWRPGAEIPMADVPSGTGRVYFGHSRIRDRQGKLPLVAVETDLERWQLLYADRQLTLEAPEGGEVFGVAFSSDRRPGLLVVSEDRHSIQLCGKGFSAHLVSSPSSIAGAVASPSSPFIVWTTEDGALQSKSLKSRRRWTLVEGVGTGDRPPGSFPP